MGWSKDDLVWNAYCVVIYQSLRSSDNDSSILTKEKVVDDSEVDSLIKSQIVKRTMKYYLTTEGELSNIRLNSILAELLLFLSTVAFTWYFSRTSEYPALVLGIVLFVLFCVFAFIHFRAIKRVLDSGEPRSFSLTSATSTKRVESKTDLTILSATYGAEGKVFDVKDILQSLVQDGRLETLATNDLAGDPIYGVVKTLLVNYEFENVVIEKSFIEGQEVRLP